MSIRYPFALVAALLALTIFNPPVAADAAGFNQFVGFGDSTFDSGYFRYCSTGILALDSLIAAAVAGGDTGAFVGNGVMNSTLLASRFGLNAAPSSNGGTNYANGGSYTMTYGTPQMPANVSAVQQIQNYLASVNGVANPRALYVIKSGDNDLNYTNPPADYLSNSAVALATQTAVLQAAGARTIIVPNSYNCAVFAELGGDIAPANQAAYNRSRSYGLERWSALSAAGVHFVPADIDAVFRYVVHNPFSFGFTPGSVLTSNAPAKQNPSPYNSALLAYPLTDAQQQGYLFCDHVHLTTAGQTIEADYEYSLLVAPSQISLLAESVVQGGRARAATIQGQIEVSGQNRGPSGHNVWTSVGAYNMRFKNAPGFADDSGTPLGGTIGMDYLSENGVIAGAAFTANSQRQEFSTGGFFDQVDEAPSLYVAYMGGPLWGNAVMTCDMFQDKVERFVPLGTFTDRNSATTTGHSLELALRGGVDATFGRITTGPVFGFVMQEATVYGFTETGTSGATALSFGTQTRDSIVSQLGWRVLADLGNLQPFAEANWNHELSGQNRTVMASLTSVAAPSYAMDAVPLVSDWATFSLGTCYRLSPRVVLRGSASSVFCNPQMIGCGGELGLNVGF